MPNGRSGDIRLLMWPMHRSLYYVGYDVLPPFVAHGIQGGGLAYEDQDAFREHLEAQKAVWGTRLTTIERDAPIAFAGWDDRNTDEVAQGDSLWAWRGLAAARVRPPQVGRSLRCLEMRLLSGLPCS